METTIFVSLGVVHLCFFVWIWKRTPKRRRRKHGYSQQLKRGGYWKQLSSLSNLKR